MENLFKEKVILFTGEVNTLSLGIIHSFLKEMATVIFPAKSLHKIEMVKSFRDISRYKNLVTQLIDDQDFDRVIETCETIKEKYNKIDIAIQMPEFSSCKKNLTEASIDEWNNMMETDMAPFFMGARIVLNLMKGNPKGMFVHISDGRFFEDIKSCTLARLAFSTKMEMSKIFAEEAQRDGIRYYHILAQNLSCNETSQFDGRPLLKSAETITSEIIHLYQEEIYNTEMAFQSFPKQLLHQPA